MAHISRVQSIIMGKSRKQELEAAYHIASAVRTQRVKNAGALLADSFVYSPGPKPREWFGLLILFSLIKII